MLVCSLTLVACAALGAAMKARLAKVVRRIVLDFIAVWPANMSGLDPTSPLRIQSPQDKLKPRVFQGEHELTGGASPSRLHRR